MCLCSCSTREEEPQDLASVGFGPPVGGRGWRGQGSNAGQRACAAMLTRGFAQMGQKVCARLAASENGVRVSAMDPLVDAQSVN